MQNPLVSSCHQSVTILWRFNYPFYLPQSESCFWKTQMQSYHPLASNTSMVFSALKIKSQVFSVAMKPCAGCPLPLRESSLHHAHACCLQCVTAATLVSCQLPECISPSQIYYLNRILSLLFLVNLSKYFVLQISVEIQLLQGSLS